eukprot:gene21189-28089_t
MRKPGDHLPEKGRLLMYLNDTYYQLAQRHAEVPRMTSEQQEALDLVISLASSPKFRMDYWLEPGDMQILHNHSCFHTRTAFKDFEDPTEKRHLLRLWISPPPELAWPLPECFAEQYGAVTPGDRGGITVQGFKERIPLEAE